MYEHDTAATEDSRTTAQTVTRVLTLVWLVVTSLQFGIWFVVCLVSWHFVSPWWLWSLLGGGIVVVALRWFSRSGR